MKKISVIFMIFFIVLFFYFGFVSAATCGNNVVEGGEACDGTNVSGMFCSNLVGFNNSLPLECKNDCSGYIVNQCSNGKSITALSCGQTDVQNAINSASNGDRVNIPSGNCTWTNTLFINNKSIILNGAGINQTIISKNSSSNNLFISAHNSAFVPFRITGFTIKSNLSWLIYGIEVQGESKNWRIDHIKFENMGGSQILVDGFSYGLIDNNLFINNLGVSVDPEELYDFGYSAWARYPSIDVAPLKMGVADSVYIEDNYFFRDGSVIGNTFGETIASNRGGRYVARHNVFTNTKMNVLTSDHDAHGMCNDFDRGTRSWESYDNIFNIDGNWARVMYFRGGDGVVFNNTFNYGNNAGSSIAFQLTDYRSNINSDINGQCRYGFNPKDGKTYLTLAQGLSYPAPDQIREAYFWNNKDKNNNSIVPSVSGTNFIQLGRDYFNYAKPNYVPYPYPHPLISSASVNTIQVNNCSLTAVQNAVNSAARGDIILVPAGSCAWGSTLSINKGIILKGVGSDSTIITGSNALIDISPDLTSIANEEMIKIEGFTFDGNNSALNLINIYGASAISAKPFKNLVIGKNKFKNTGMITSGSGVISIRGQVRGVIYNNIFDRCNVILKVMGNDNVLEWFNGNFPFAYGSSDNLFFENNTIKYSSAFSGQDPGWTETGQGARIVMRYNSWDLTGITHSELWDIHGFQNWPSNGQTGTMISEYYGNTIKGTSAGRWITHRGGLGLFFNNNNTGSGAIEVNQYASGDIGGSGCTSDVSGALGIYKTEVRDTYVFNNIVKNVLTNMGQGPIGDGCGVSENNGYWNYNPSFTGAIGIGRGTLLNRPATCTAGSAYWVADNFLPTTNSEDIQSGTLYKCTSTNNWTRYYTPYVYPHPLVQTDFVGKTYYVSTSGNDNNPGTEASPFRTIQKAANVVASGESVYVRGGIYEEYVRIGANGNGSYITFQPYPGENVITRGFGINMGKFISIKGFEIANVSTSSYNSYGNGISIENGANNIKIIGNYIHHTFGTGIFAIPAGPISSQYYTNISNLSIINNTIYRARSAGLTIFANNVNIEGNEISLTTSYWNGVTGNYDADGIRIWGNGFLIRKNYIHNMTILESPVGHNDCLQTWDINYPSLNNLVFEYNYCENIDSEMIEFEGQYKNLSNNITFRNNLFYLTPGATINNHGVKNVSWYNNNIISCGAITNVQNASGIIKNNIFYNVKMDYPLNYYNENPAPNITGDYNLLYPNVLYPDHSPMPHDVHADPLFVNVSNPLGNDGTLFTSDDGLRLKAGSPAIGSGENGKDIGAYEYINITIKNYHIADTNTDNNISSLELNNYISSYLSGSYNLRNALYLITLKQKGGKYNYNSSSSCDAFPWNCWTSI